MIAFQLPAGPKQLAELFNTVDFTKVDEYYLELVNGGTTFLTTNRYKRACCCGDDNIRVFFVNYLGGIDAINFSAWSESTETKSDSWKKPLVWPLRKFDGGIQRFNVESNETVTAENRCFGETDQEYLKELFASPQAWVQWIGTQGQDDDYIPIVIKDGNFDTRKVEGRYEYITTIQFVYANENSVLRN